MILEVKVTLPLAKQMERFYSDKKEKGLYTNNVKRMDLVDIAEYAEKANKKQVNPESMCNSCTQSTSGIRLTQSGFKVIGFTNSEKRQVGEPVRGEEFMVYLVNTPFVLNDNSLLFKNNVKYA